MLKPKFRRILIFFSCLIFSWFINLPSAAAISSDVLKQLQYPFYDPNSSDVCSLVVSGNSPDDSKTTWNSGLQPPYILEQFAIETLKDIASKMNVDQSSAVTKEHVIALVAFMYGEGGDIINQDLFNPLNTGIDAPDLLASANAVNGVQSFKSFDAGVEATARTMVGTYQRRLAEVLTQPDSTAKQFMYALTYFQKFPGNKFWASASLPPNEDSYYQGRLSIVQQVKNNYAGTAGLVLGTPQKEFLLNQIQPSKLQFKVGPDSTASDSNVDSTTACGDSGVVSGNIVQTALNLAWPTNKGMTPKQEYLDALRKYNPGVNGADCGVFISTVMKASGADPNYPVSGTNIQENYVRSHPEKYDVVNSVSSTADLQPGDILIVNAGSGAGADGHTYIFVGPQSNGLDEASASLNTRMPNLGKAVLADNRGNYVRARLK